MLICDSFQTMEQNLIRSTGVTAGKAKLLVRTESNAIMNDTVRQVIDSNPLVKGYRFRAVLDSRTSKICQEHDGEYIPKDQAKPGVNYPPLHPNCRSTVTTVLFNENEPSFICYGVPSQSKTTPPDELENACVWLPVGDGENGYWVIYQSARNGSIVK